MLNKLAFAKLNPTTKLYSEPKRVKLYRGASLKINDNRLLLADKPRFVGRMRQHSKATSTNTANTLADSKLKVGRLSYSTET